MATRSSSKTQPLAKSETNEKYELTEESIGVDGHRLHRIRALKDFSDVFSDVKAGDLGGFVESEENLSHEGTCWIYDDAQVYGEAQVYGDAKIYGNAKVWGKVKVYDNAKVFAKAQIHSIRGDVQVCGNARLFEDVNLIGDGDLIVGGHQDW